MKQEHVAKEYAFLRDLERSAWLRDAERMDIDDPATPHTCPSMRHTPSHIKQRLAVQSSDLLYELDEPFENVNRILEEIQLEPLQQCLSDYACGVEADDNFAEFEHVFPQALMAAAMKTRDRMSMNLNEIRETDPFSAQTPSKYYHDNRLGGSTKTRGLNTVVMGQQGFESSPTGWGLAHDMRRTDEDRVTEVDGLLR